jgi:iron complex outermembrane receptor protein
MRDLRRERLLVFRAPARYAAAILLSLSLGPLSGLDAAAQDQDEPAEEERKRGGASAMIESIVVFATKKSELEAIQEVPVSMSGYGEDQIEAMKVQDIESLSYVMPNVSLDAVGTTKGVANFSIRGLGINSSIPSIDPTVGVFVDGMYLGVNFGVVMDTFDLEAVEVLRGPQGLLFGRNVTGGAVLLRSKRPGNEFATRMKASYETGPQWKYNASVEGPIIDGILSARLSGQFRNDQGWFENDFDGSDSFGEEETWVFKPVLAFTPTDTFDATLFYEHGDTDADGPVAQNRSRFDDFDVNLDEEGFADIEWDHAILEMNLDVAFGDGKITNIFGWRDLEQESLSDIDSLPIVGFHGFAYVDQDQLSNELRYSGRLTETVGLTAGVYYFEQDIKYLERRILSNGLIDSSLGGEQDQETWGLFAQAEIDLTPTLTAILGGRYTYEEKDVKVATFVPSTPGSRCNYGAKSCVYDFEDDDSWNNFTPKVGLQWWAGDNVQIYGHYTKGFRSGGYNFRDTDLNPAIEPGPFDEEEQDSFELGMKSDWMDGRLRFNLTGFYNEIEDMQRELNIPSPAGVTQIIRNTADATIMGVEAEITALVTENFALNVSAGYTDGEYDQVRFDLDDPPTGQVDGNDESKDLPRLANRSLNVGATYDIAVGDLGLMTLRGNYAYRDDSKYTDSNLGELPSGSIIDASIAFALYDWPFTFTVYGKNLADEVFWGGDSQLPSTIVVTPVGGTFSPLKEGRVVGVEVTADF